MLLGGRDPGLSCLAQNRHPTDTSWPTHSSRGTCGVSMCLEGRWEKWGMPELPLAILVSWESVPPALERWVWLFLFPEEEIKAWGDGMTCLRSHV